MVQAVVFDTAKGLTCKAVRSEHRKQAADGIPADVAGSRSADRDWKRTSRSGLWLADRDGERNVQDYKGD